jgi:hypothetical protein
MAKQRYQTTFTFSDRESADKFAAWLKRNTNDADYGHPKYVDLRAVSATDWCVEYSADNDMPRGVATGLDLQNH